ncbi:hypothetical protein ATCC90586_001316 [Pythium insidiosum]|nr:hypothetical protein ATCC90586_001316 [Pythium insidiosum]
MFTRVLATSTPRSRPPVSPSASSRTHPLIEFMSDEVYYTTRSTPPPAQDRVVFYSIDDKLTYHNFFLDFGPHNLGCTFQFCLVMNKMLASARLERKQIHFYSAPDPQLRANAVCLLTCWGVLFQGMTPDKAFAPFAQLHFPSFHDASPTTSSFRLSILDCLNGLNRAVVRRFLEPTRFNLQEYHHYEQVEHGDLTWVSPKFVAFAGPQNEYALSPDGYVTLTPEHYLPYFKKRNVTLVVRLNENLYDARRFTQAGIAHLDLFYPDGANPSPALLDEFLRACEATPGAVAVHCKAGLGRTGTCIAAYLMKHDGFAAKEAIGWLRLCRPGSVIGPQQEYLESIQQRMWKLKDQERVVTEKASSGFIVSRTINIFGIKRPIELSKTESPRSVLKEHETSSKVDEVSQGDRLVRLKQKYQHRYVR